MNFIVEHKIKGHYVMETICNAEEIDTTIYQDLLGVWVCDSMDEVRLMERQLQELRHVR